MIKRWLMKILSRTLFNGIMLDVYTWKGAPEAKNYLQDARHIHRSEAFHNEIRRMANAAGSSIMRQTSVNDEVSFNRGILYAAEYLEKRFKELASKDKTKE